MRVVKKCNKFRREKFQVLQIILMDFFQGKLKEEEKQNINFHIEELLMIKTLVKMIQSICRLTTNPIKGKCTHNICHLHHHHLIQACPNLEIKTIIQVKKLLSTTKDILKDTKEVHLIITILIILQCMILNIQCLKKKAMK